MSKKVLRLTDHALFDSVKEAAAASFITPSAISKALKRGNGATAGGHVWARVAAGSPTVLPQKPEKKAAKPAKQKAPRPAADKPEAKRLKQEVDASLQWFRQGALDAEDALGRIRRAC